MEYIRIYRSFGSKEYTPLKTVWNGKCCSCNVEIPDREYSVIIDKDSKEIYFCMNCLNRICKEINKYKKILLLCLDDSCLDKDMKIKLVMKFIDLSLLSHLQPERLNPEDASNSVCDSLNNMGTC